MSITSIQHYKHIMSVFDAFLPFPCALWKLRVESARKIDDVKVGDDDDVTITYNRYLRLHWYDMINLK